MVFRRASLVWLVAVILVLALSEVSRAGLMSHYQFEGDATDSVGGNHGTPSGGPTYAPGRKGQAVELNGSNQYFDTVTAGNMRLQGDFTVSAWINPDATNGDRTIFGTDQGGDYVGLHLIVRDDRAHLGFYGHDTGGSSTIPTNQWTHVAWQYDGQTQRIYVNGQLDASSGGHAAFNGNDTVKIGRWAGGRYFDGRIDEISVFNHPLSAEQVEQLADGANPTSIGSLPPPGQMFALPTGPAGEWNVYSLATTTRTWDEARVYATNTSFLGVAGHLATMRDATENGMIGILGGGDRWIGLTDSHLTSPLDGTALGGTEAGTNPNGGWVWVNGEPFVYQAFGGGEPNDSGGEDATILRGDGLWNDHQAGGTLGQGDHRTASLIEYDTLLAAPPQLPGRGQIDPLTGHYYERVNAAFTWDESRVDAQNRVLGGVAGHLATISDAIDNEAVRRAGGEDNKWIGFHDSDQTSTLDGTALGATEGTFQWVDGSPAAYTNWGGGEPNDAGGSEDATHIRSDGYWNDHQAGSTLGQSDQRLTSVVEYEPSMPFTASYLERKADTGVFGTLNLAQAKVLLGLPSGDPAIAAEGTADVYAISFQDPQAGGGRGEYIRQAFLTDTPADDQDFAVQVLGEVLIPDAGEWTFAVSHDDHFELNVGPNSYTSPGCCGSPSLINGSNVFSFPEAGLYDFSLYWHERGGGAYLQVFAARGIHGTFDPNVFALVGDVYNGGLAFGVPEPSSFVLALLFGLAAIAFGWRRRRKAA